MEQGDLYNGMVLRLQLAKIPYGDGTFFTIWSAVSVASGKRHIINISEEV